MIKLAVVGTGSMGTGHAKRINAMKGVKLVAGCDVFEPNLKNFQEKTGAPHIFTDYEKMMREVELDGVVNATTDSMHAPVAIAAAKAGVHILSEKPLATSLAEGKKMMKAVEKAGVIHMVNFSYRKSSGLQNAAKVVAAGKIGRVMHVESSYLQSWLVGKHWGDWRTEPHWLWRLSKKHGSLGTLGDIGVHIFDATRFLAGDISEINCQLKTHDKGKKREGQYVFDANDSFVATVGFAGGGMGTVHATRWATGNVNSLRLRVWGDLGAVEVDLDRNYNEYRICSGKKARENNEWKTVACKETPGNMERFVKSIKTGKPDPSDFMNALKVQAYLEYCFKSAESGKTCKVRI